RETSVTDTNGLTTTFVYDLGGRKTTKTRPDLSTEIRENYLDRRLKSVTGTGVVNEFHDWLFTRDRTTNALMFAVASFHTIQYGSTNSTRQRTEGLDWAGRAIRFESGDFTSTNKIIEHHRFYRMWTSHADTIEKALGSPGTSTSTTLLKSDFMQDMDGSTNVVCLEVDDGVHYWNDTPAQLSRY